MNNRPKNQEIIIVKKKKKKRPELRADTIQCGSARSIVAQLLDRYSWVSRKKEQLESFLSLDPIDPWVVESRQKLFDALKKYPGKHYPEAGEKLEKLFFELEQELKEVLPSLRQIPEETGSGFSSEQILPDLAIARIHPLYGRKLTSNVENFYKVPIQKAETIFQVKIFLSKHKIIVQGEKANEAMNWLEKITEPESGVGATITGEISKVTDFGVFIEFGMMRYGLLHNSEIEPQDLERIETGSKIKVIISRTTVDGKILFKNPSIIGYNPKNEPIHTTNEGVDVFE